MWRASNFNKMCSFIEHMKHYVETDEIDIQVM